MEGCILVAAWQCYVLALVLMMLMWWAFIWCCCLVCCRQLLSGVVVTFFVDGLLFDWMQAIDCVDIEDDIGVGCIKFVILLIAIIVSYIGHCSGGATGKPGSSDFIWSINNSLIKYG